MISIVIPCFNEEAIIEDFIKELNINLSKIDESFEVIFVDNKSKDSTVEKIKENLKSFQKSKIICLTNYFGKEAAILSGIDNSSGDSCIIMDPDLEDPPNLISEMIQQSKKGYNVVYAVRRTIETTFLKKIMRSIFYFLYRTFVDKNFTIPENTGDFRLLDKKIIEQIKNMRERTRFLRGLVSFIGANQKSIEFDRPFRKKGKSKSGIIFLIRYGFDALLSSTAGPASLITKFGIFSLSMIFVFLIFVLMNKFFFNPYEGFSFTIILILFLFSLNTIMIGIIGEYVTRIYNEVKQRPNYIIEEIID